MLPSNIGNVIQTVSTGSAPHLPAPVHRGVECGFIQHVDTPCGQSISNTRPSRLVILSAAKDLWRDSVQILRCAQDDTPASASFDSQHVLFEMDCPLRVSCGESFSAPHI